MEHPGWWENTIWYQGVPMFCKEIHTHAFGMIRETGDKLDEETWDFGAFIAVDFIGYGKVVIKINLYST